MTHYENEFKDPNETVPLDSHSIKNPKASSIPAKKVERGEPSKLKEEKTDEDLLYNHDVSFDHSETNCKNGTKIICTLSGVIARSPAGSGPQSPRRAVHQVVKYYFTGKSINQVDTILTGLDKIFTLTLLYFSRTCRGLQPVAGTEMPLENTLLT